MKPFALTKHETEISRIRELTQGEIDLIGGGSGERYTTYCAVGEVYLEGIGWKPWYGLDDYEGPPGTTPGIGG